MLHSENKNYRLTLAYDGTDYHGWQIQPDCLTITGLIQEIFAQVFKRECRLIGASRTDAGVHALGQVAKLETKLDLAPDLMRTVLNSHLPSDVLIRTLECSPAQFHPQSAVAKKIYYYHFFTERPLPFIARYGYYYRFPFEREKLEECLKVFVGTYDFRSFCTGDEMQTTIRTIDSIRFYFFRRYNVYRIEVQGHSFARFMIRRILGASLQVASHSQLQPEDLRKALADCNPLQPYATAPAQGLMLYKIYYKN